MEPQASVGSEALRQKAKGPYSCQGTHVSDPAHHLVVVVEAESITVLQVSRELSV